MYGCRELGEAVILVCLVADLVKGLLLGVCVKCCCAQGSTSTNVHQCGTHSRGQRDWILSLCKHQMMILHLWHEACLHFAVAGGRVGC